MPKYHVKLSYRGAQVHQKIAELELDAGTLVVMIGTEHMLKSLPDYSIAFDAISYKQKRALALAEQYHNDQLVPLLRGWLKNEGAPRGTVGLH